MPDWLSAALAYVPEWLGYQVRHTQQPGCSLAVAHGGEVVLEMAFGLANVVTGEALTPRHRFRVASHSKSFTAAAVMKLREQGRLRLDDTAGQFVAGLHPEIAGATLAQLLSHTAGIVRDGPDNPFWLGRAPFWDEAQLRQDLALAPIIPAATRMKYSNHGFGLAGLVVEAAAGEPWRAFVGREVVAAAGLGETYPDAPIPAGTPFAAGHSGRALLGRRLVFPGDQPAHALAPATGFVSTAADLARFYSQLDPDAPASFLSVASRREMTRPQWPVLGRGEPAPTYGLGVIGAQHGGWVSLGHAGGFQGYISRTCAIRGRAITVSLLTNAVDGPADLWMEGVLHILRRFEAAGPPGPAVADWTGRWWATWGPCDLVPLGEKVLMASPALANPFLNAPELAVADADTAHIAEAGGFGSHGEAVRRLRDAAGRVVAIDNAGSRLVPEAELAAELVARYGP